MRELSWVRLEVGILNRIRMLERRFGADRALSRYIRLVIALALRTHSFNISDPYDQEELLEILGMEDVEEQLDFLSLCARSDLVDRDAFTREGLVSVEAVSEAIEYRKKKSQAGKEGMKKRWSKDEKTEKDELKLVK